jgi:hypothetical protein
LLGLLGMAIPQAVLSKPANVIPLKDGYFEMQLPTPFFEGQPKSITLN